jgi:hypothetical protein
MFILALGGMIDPTAINLVIAFLAQFGLNINGNTILMLCALLVLLLKQLALWAEPPEIKG